MWTGAEPHTKDREPGAAISFEAFEHVRITSSQPILVAQLLEGNGAFGDVLSFGDPSLGIIPAASQYLSAYTFSENPGWDVNYVSIIKVSGANGALISWTTHVATGSHPFGLIQYGYQGFASYLYAVGLKLTANCARHWHSTGKVVAFSA